MAYSCSVGGVFCHGRGRGFESRSPRHSFQALAKNRQELIWSNLVHLDHCLSLPKYSFNKLALSLPFLWHSRLRIEIECDSAVCMTQQLLYNFHVLLWNCAERIQFCLYIVAARNTGKPRYHLGAGPR